MEVLCWIKPEVDPLFTVVESIGKYVCLDDIWFAFHIAKELKVYFITVRLIRCQLHRLSETDHTVLLAIWRLAIVIRMCATQIDSDGDNITELKWY